MQIACAQTHADLGQVAANLDRIGQLAGDAARAGAELVLFPELMTTGYGPPDTVGPLAESIPGPSADHIAALASRLRIAIAAGLPERDDTTGLVHNTLLLLDAAGREVLRYRKVHLWDTERSWARPGDDFPVRTLRGLRIGAIICYDVRFPEGVRSLALAGAQLILLPTAWLGPVDEWELAVRSRALDNGIFLAASALQGDAFRGSSLIVDPHGTVIARGQPGADELLLVDLDPEAVNRFRQRVPLLDDRRPETYSN